MAGIVSYGVYLPYARLDRKDIGAALGTPPGRGTRAVASFDEDTTSMGVEAARHALSAAPDGTKAEMLTFATADPAYLDKTNASAIHAALGLDQSVPAYDMIGSVRSGAGAMRAASDAATAGRNALAVLSDIRTGLPGGADERDGGDAAAAHPGLLLADVLDRAQPGQTIALVILADGAEVVVFRATDALANYQRSTTVAQQVEGGGNPIPYATYLTWRGQLHREPPRRPDPERPAAPPSLRHENWKFGFVGSRCLACGTRHLPPQRVCVNCQAIDQMTPERLADLHATIATF